MIHSSGDGLALDVDHRDRIGDHTAHSFCTDHASLHVPHASEAILGCEPTELCLLSQICYESYSATEIPLYPTLLPHGAKPGSAPDLDQLLTRKVGLTPLFRPQLRDSGSEFGIPESEAEKVGVDWTRGYAAEHTRRVCAGGSVSASSATPSWFWSIDDKPS